MGTLKLRSKEYYQYMVDSITEEAIKKILSLNEYAVKTANFRATVDGLWYRIMEHWCYLKYAQIYEPQRQERNHWARELSSWLEALQNVKLKSGGRKSIVLVKVFIEEHDLDTPSEVLEMMEKEFFGEKFCDKNAMESVCKTFSSKVYDIIKLVDSNQYKVKDYIKEELFS